MVRGAPRLRTVFKQMLLVRRRPTLVLIITPYYVLSSKLCEGNIAESKIDSLREMA
jgi:hypothetical protein